MIEPKGARKKTAKAATPTALPVIRPRVAGIDIGSAQHWVCGPARAESEPNVRVFGTTTDQLHALADWLIEQHVESVAMESTSVYWIPVYELLESRGVEVVLLNARQLHHVPGRKIVDGGVPVRLEPGETLTLTLSHPRPVFRDENSGFEEYAVYHPTVETAPGDAGSVDDGTRNRGVFVQPLS